MASSRLPSLGRRVGDDHRARAVDRDRPLVALPVLARDDLALVVEERRLRIVVVDQPLVGNGSGWCVIGFWTGRSVGR